MKNTGFIHRLVTFITAVLMIVCFTVGCSSDGDQSGSSVADNSSQSSDSGVSDDSSDSGSGEIPENPEFSDHVKEIYACDDIVASYFAAKTEQEQYDIITAYANTYHDEQPIVKIYVKNGVMPYTVKLADNESLNNAVVSSSNSKQISLGGMLIPGKTYYYEVADSTDAVVYRGTIIVNASPVRVISVGGGRNIRDLGGYKTENGKTVKYGLLLRGAQLNGRKGGPMLSAAGIETMRNVLGVKTELDLRTGGDNGDDGGQTACFFGEDRNYFKYSLNQYDRALTAEQSLTSLNKIFKMLADENSYPVYFHCNAGADRTGTLAYLINGLLGVSYEDLTKDFELTSLGGQGMRLRSDDTGSGYGTTGVFQDNANNYVAWGKMHKYIEDNYSSEATLSAKIEKFLIEKAQITQNEIQQIKSIMLAD